MPITTVAAIISVSELGIAARPTRRIVILTIRVAVRMWVGRTIKPSSLANRVQYLPIENTRTNWLYFTAATKQISTGTQNTGDSQEYV